MTIEIFWGSGSPYAWRVLLTLEVKGVPYESHLLSFAKQEHKTPEMLALNPRGKVPVMRDGDLVLPESLAIMAYIDRKHPEPPLFGRTAEEAGRIWKSISETAFYFSDASRRIVLPFFRGSPSEQADEIRSAAEDVQREFAMLEGVLGRQDWLVGDTFTAADITLYPHIELLLRVAGREDAAPLGLGLLPFADLYPATDAWRARMTGLPGYERTFPPHWREAA